MVKRQVPVFDSFQMVGCAYVALNEAQLKAHVCVCAFDLNENDNAVCNI